MDEIHKIVSFLSGQASLEPVTLKEEETDTELTLIDEYVGEQLLMDEQMCRGLKPNENPSPCLFQPICDSKSQLKTLSPSSPYRVTLKNEPYSMNHRYHLRPRKGPDQRYPPNFNHAQPILPYTQIARNNNRPKGSSSHTFNKKEKKDVRIKPVKIRSKFKGLFPQHTPRSERVSKKDKMSKPGGVDLKSLKFFPLKNEKLESDAVPDVNKLSTPNNGDLEHMFGFPPDVYIKQEERGDIVIHLRRAKSGNLTTWYCCKNQKVVAKPKTRRSKARKKSKKRKLHKDMGPFCRGTLRSILRKMLRIHSIQKDSRNPKKSQVVFTSPPHTDNRFVEKRSKIGEECILECPSKGPYRFACSGCDYKTNTRNQMFIHLRRHKGEKPFKCAHCVYSSVEKSHLTRHMKIHTGERPHKCTFCNYSCIQKVSLDHHLLRFH